MIFEHRRILVEVTSVKNYSAVAVGVAEPENVSNHGARCSCEALDRLRELQLYSV